MTPDEIKAVTKFINSSEAADIVVYKFSDNWPNLKAKLEVALARPMTEEEDQSFYSDLRDWWKNGNFWADGGWVYGEWPFWPEG